MDSVTVRVLGALVFAMWVTRHLVAELLTRQISADETQQLIEAACESVTNELDTWYPTRVEDETGRLAASRAFHAEAFSGHGQVARAILKRAGTLPLDTNVVGVPTGVVQRVEPRHFCDSRTS